MKLCPHCRKVFDLKCDKLYCAAHGWHSLNSAGEIIPAEAPTADDLRIWEFQQKRPKESEQAQAEIIPAAAAGPVDMPYSSKAIVAGITAAALLGYAYYRRRQQRRQV